MRCSVLCAIVVATPLLAATAHAGEPAGEREEAERLFLEAQKLRGQSRYAEACPLLEQSQALDPAVGTQLYLADCYEQTNRRALAHRTFREAEAAARASGKNDRAEQAHAAAAALEPKLCRVSIALDATASSVSLDGAAVAPSALGEPISVDPGPHEASATATDGRTVTEKGNCAAGELITLALRLAPAVVAPPPPPPPPPPEPSGPALGVQRIAAIAVAGAGVVGVAIGTGLAVSAKSSYDDSAEFCDEATSMCGDEGFALREEAFDKATGADVAFIIGGVALAGGVVLWFTAPDEAHGADARTAPSIGVAAAPAGVVVTGRW